MIRKLSHWKRKKFLDVEVISCFIRGESWRMWSVHKRGREGEEMVMGEVVFVFWLMEKTKGTETTDGNDTGGILLFHGCKCYSVCVSFFPFEIIEIPIQPHDLAEAFPFPLPLLLPPAGDPPLMNLTNSSTVISGPGLGPVF